MTFQDLAGNLGLSAGALRVLFCQKKWSIHRPKDVQKFISTRFSERKIQRRKQPWRSVVHLKKWQFTKKIKQVEVSPAEEKLARKSALVAAKERKRAAVARVAVAEKSAEQAEKIRILEEKLKQNEAVVAAKERKIAALTRRAKSEDPTPLSFGHLPLAGENETSTPLPRGVPNKVRRGSPTEKIKVVENPTPDFGVVPSAESRKAAARARQKEKEGLRIKDKEEKSRERKPLSHVPEIPVVEKELGDENFRPATPVESAKTPKTPEIKAEQPKHNPPAKGGDPTPQRRVGGSASKQQKSLNSVPSSPDPSVLRTSPLGRGETNLPVETLTTEITALRAEIREQIGKLEIKEEEVFAEIPVEKLVAETAQSRIEPQVQQTIEKIEPQIIEQPEPTPEPNIVIPAKAGTQKTPESEPNIVIPAKAGTQKTPVTEIPTPESESPVAETAQSRIEPQVQQTIEQPQPQTAPPNPPS